MDGETDAELMRRVKRGEKAAFGALVDRYKAAMVSYLRRMTGSRDRADELAQEAFVRLYVATPECPEPGRLAPWLYRTATNLVRSEERRALRWRLFRLAARANGVAAQGGQEAELLAAEAGRRLEAALAALPVRYRAPLVLHEIEELPLGEIARLLGCAEGTVKSRISRARARLRHALAPYWNGEES